jgi:hypothetical protein
VVTVQLVDPLLYMAAETLDGLEKERKAAANRLRQLTRKGPDKDGKMRGFGLDPSHPDVRRQGEVLAHLKQVEHEEVLALTRIFRRHPLYQWQQDQVGVGEKQLARLLAAIGDPYIRPEIVREDGTVEPSRPRGVRELYALCGFKPGQRRQRGVRSNWSTEAKTRAYLIAESCIKQDGEDDIRGRHRRISPYREHYNRKKAHYDAVGVHLHVCIPCGPKGDPSQPGSPLSQKCKHMRSLRFAAKMMLRDLWRECRRLHEQGIPGGSWLPDALPAAGQAYVDAELDRLDDEDVAVVVAAPAVPADRERPVMPGGEADDGGRVRFRSSG